MSAGVPNRVKLSENYSGPRSDWGPHNARGILGEGFDAAKMLLVLQPGIYMKRTGSLPSQILDVDATKNIRFLITPFIRTGYAIRFKKG